METQPVHKLTPEEYLAIERNAETKSEYCQGEMFAMSGASYRHVRIVGNLSFNLRLRLQRGHCRPTASDLRLQVSSTGFYTYPDVVVTCGEPRFADSKPDTRPRP